jgi:protein-disulfide isomerase
VPRPAPAPKRRSSLTPFYVILGLVLLAGIGLLATKLKPGSQAAANTGVAVQLTPEELQRVQGISIGRADAPITIYEFADYQCPHCAQFAAFIEPLIRQNLVETGKARYVFYEFPLNFKWSFLSARAGRCANEQGKFWDFHGIVFARQRQWSFDPDAAAQFVEYARTIPGMDVDKFEQCVRSDRYQKEVSASHQFGLSLGVGGTPSLYVNGRKIEPLPESYSELEARLREIAPDVFAGAAAAPAAAPAAPGDTAGKVTGQSTQP